MILDVASVDRDVSLSADVCVVGSGAGGAIVAQELAQAGQSVVVVEEGPYIASRDFTQREEQMLPRLYADQSLRTAADATVLVLQGSVVGGSMVPGFCVCVRTPSQILASWGQRFGLSGIGFEAMLPYFERVEAASHVHPLRREELNLNNEKLRVGAERLGLRHYLPSHNRVDCVECGFCALGCAYDRKADALTVYLPAASSHGAVIVPSCRVERVEQTGGRAQGVSGRFVRAGAPFALNVRAPVVVLAAGAIGSPALWLRSQLPDHHKQVGRNLHLHPEVLLAARFPERIAMWQGIPQALIVDEFLDLDHSVMGGFLMTPRTAHPVEMGALVPGMGSEVRQVLEDYAHLALAAVMLHDRTAGHLDVDGDGRVSIVYHLGDDDRADLLDGMRQLADVHFAAGAQEVILPYNEYAVLSRRGDYRAIDERQLRDNDPLLLSYHPQGTLRMGPNRKRSVVNGWGAAHEIEGLYVADASIFPTSTAVPPLLSVMAFAARTAQHIREQLA
jgi:choline dehydrogenase-like flavoprotein